MLQLDNGKGVRTLYLNAKYFDGIGHHRQAELDLFVPVLQTI